MNEELVLRELADLLTEDENPFISNKSFSLPKTGGGSSGFKSNTGFGKKDSYKANVVGPKNLKRTDSAAVADRKAREYKGLPPRNQPKPAPKPRRSGGGQRRPAASMPAPTVRMSPSDFGIGGGRNNSQTIRNMNIPNMDSSGGVHYSDGYGKYKGMRPR